MFLGLSYTEGRVAQLADSKATHNTIQLFQISWASKPSYGPKFKFLPVAHFILYRAQCFPSHCSECYSAWSTGVNNCWHRNNCKWSCPQPFGCFLVLLTALACTHMVKCCLNPLCLTHPQSVKFWQILTSLPFLSTLIPWEGENPTNQSSSFYSQHDAASWNCTKPNCVIGACFCQCPSSALSQLCLRLHCRDGLGLRPRALQFLMWQSCWA